MTVRPKVFNLISPHLSILLPLPFPYPQTLSLIPLSPILDFSLPPFSYLFPVSFPSPIWVLCRSLHRVAQGVKHTDKGFAHWPISPHWPTLAHWLSGSAMCGCGYAICQWQFAIAIAGNCNRIFISFDKARIQHVAQGSMVSACHPREHGFSMSLKGAWFLLKGANFLSMRA